MRFLGLVLLSGICAAQTANAPTAASATSTASSSAPAATSSSAPAPEIKLVTIPAGTKIPLELKQAISTKTAKEGDPVYAETAFPFVLNERIMIPAHTYVQGKIMHTQRGGHVKGRAELLVHFTSLIYPNGYTVMLGGNVENAPGAEHSAMKDQEGTIRQDSDAARKAKEAAGGAITGAVIGGITNGGKGAGIGAGTGGVAGLAIAMLSRGADIRLEPGTSLEMEIQREISLDPSRIKAAAN
ncbi:MAG TPA: YMGG-like glycine zipper-containing protein [Terriglobales bacterium]|nr:YMGG-like glycine zipper-containing protein [Terriglobales bacterium]